MNTAEKSRHCGRKKGITLDFPVREGFLEEVTVEQRTLWKRVVAVVQSLSRIRLCKMKQKSMKSLRESISGAGPAGAKALGWG